MSDLIPLLPVLLIPLLSLGLPRGREALRRAMARTT